MRLGLDEDAVLMEDWGVLRDGAAAMVAEEVERLKVESDIHFADIVRPTVEQVQDVVQADRPDILLFDFLQKIKSSRGGSGSRLEAWADAATTFPELAVNLPCAAIVGSQVKRKGDGVFSKYRPPTEEDAKGAGEIEENAAVQLGLFRPLKPMTLKEEREVRNGERDIGEWTRDETMGVKVLKHRYRGPANDKVFRLRIRDRMVTDYEPEPPPVDAGDAWEADDDNTLF
jgi:hypothetical protein